ncbi:MAG: hypothetical protein AAF171_25070 [Cyanobacteria bacterium P01_A01_bin.116]
MASSKRILGLGISTLGLMLGFVCLGRAAETALDKDPTRLEKRETVTAGLLLGIPTTIGAGLMLSTLERNRKQARSQRLQSLFYKALKANNGKINPIQFAMLGQISLAEAQECLDAWAGPLNADFMIDDAGVVMYCFHLMET